MSCRDSIKILSEKLRRTNVGKNYTIDAEDVVNLEKMLRSTCTAMDESEKEIKRLKSRNTFLETEHTNLQVILDETINNLCLALDSKVVDKNESNTKLKEMEKNARKENENLKLSLENYKRQLAFRTKLSVDDSRLIEMLKLNAIDQEQILTVLKNKYEQATTQIKKLTGEIKSITHIFTGA